MPTTRTKKTVEKKPAAKVAKAPARRAPASRSAAAKAPPRAKAAAPAKKPAPARKPKAPSGWTPRPVPIHELDGKASDPRLAAALAARERWHGRSGRPALKSATQAVAFVRERHLVHPSVRSALPNLIDPIVGRSCSEEDRERGQPALTLRQWSKDVRSAPDLLEVRLCFERPTLVAAELWPSLLAVAAPREEAAREGGLLSPEAAETLEVLDRKGVVAVERLRQLVGLSPKELERVQGELESRLVVLARGDLDEDEQPVTVLEPLSRWAERTVNRKVDLDLGRAWTFLFIAALRSSVVLWPEELEAMFPWSPEERDAAIREAMGTGAVVTYSEGDSIAFVASPVPR